MAELTQGLPVLRQAIKAQELPLPAEPTAQAQHAREQLWGDLVAPEGRGEEREMYLDEGWDGIRESSAGWNHHFRATRKSRGAGKV